MGKTNIAWTDATWNPVTGCSKVSPGCAHCYAEALSKRFGRSFEVTLHPERLDEPLRWKKPRRVFVCSMADLFHEQVPDIFLSRVWQVIYQCAHPRMPEHLFQLLTKRPERMRAFVLWQADRLAEYAEKFDHCPTEAMRNSPAAKIAREEASHPLLNVWLGVSIENDRWVGRADILRQTPAAIRFVSAEPLLGPLPSLDLTGIDWLIIGGESGAGARWMNPEWVFDLIARAHDAGTAVFVKQASGPHPGRQGNLPDWVWSIREYPRG